MDTLLVLIPSAISTIYLIFKNKEFKKITLYKSLKKGLLDKKYRKLCNKYGFSKESLNQLDDEIDDINNRLKIVNLHRD